MSKKKEKLSELDNFGIDLNAPFYEIKTFDEHTVDYIMKIEKGARQNENKKNVK